MVNKASKSKAFEVVYRYATQRVRQAGYTWDEAGKESSSSIEVHQTMLKYGELFERAYADAFPSMLKAIDIEGDDLKQIFVKTADDLFVTGIKWGRIIGLIVFTSQLCLKAVESERTDVAKDVVGWAAEYLDSPRLREWIDRQNGWNGFVQFYANSNNEHEDMTLQKACGYGLACIAGATSLLNMFLQRT